MPRYSYNTLSVKNQIMVSPILSIPSVVGPEVRKQPAVPQKFVPMDQLGVRGPWGFNRRDQTWSKCIVIFSDLPWCFSLQKCIVWVNVIYIYIINVPWRWDGERDCKYLFWGKKHAFLVVGYVLMFFFWISSWLFWCLPIWGQVSWRLLRYSCLFSSISQKVTKWDQCAKWNDCIPRHSMGLVNCYMLLS